MNTLFVLSIIALQYAHLVAQEDDCASVRFHPFAVVGKYKDVEQQRSAFSAVGAYEKPSDQQRSAFSAVGAYEKPSGQQRSAFSAVGDYQRSNKKRSAFSAVGAYEKPSDQQRSAFSAVGDYKPPSQQRSAFSAVGDYKPPSQQRSAFSAVGDYKPPSQQRSAFSAVGDYKPPSQQRSAFSAVGDYKPPSQQRSAFNEVGAYDSKDLFDKCNFEDDDETLVRGMFQTWESLQPNNTASFGGWWGTCSNASVNETDDPKCDMNNMYACNMSSMTGETRACFNQRDEITNYGKQMLNSSDVELWFPTNMNLLPFPAIFDVSITDITPIPRCEKSIVCHNVDNDCSVAMCHSLPKTEAYQVTVEYENITDSTITMIAVCHYETHEFDKDGIGFRILHKQPGDTICHFFSPRDFVMCRKA